MLWSQYKSINEHKNDIFCVCSIVDILCVSIQKKYTTV